MKQAIKYINVTIFLILSFVFFLLSPHRQFSTNLISLLPQNEETYLLKIYENFKSTKEILVATKNIKDMKALETKVLSNESLTLQKKSFYNERWKKHIQDYRFYLQNIDIKNINHIDKILQSSYDDLVQNPSYTFIDKIDPLKIFSTHKATSNYKIKDGYVHHDDYGYINIFTFKSDVSYEKIYNLFAHEIKEDLKVFSPMFYFVENSDAIKSQVNLLVFFAMAILLALYIVILKNISLLVNTLLTLVNSSILSLFVLTFLWEDISVFVMVFGMAISTVAIDYMFHNYFCGFYERKRTFNRAVFYGFLSTFFAFFVIAFVDFPFIRQVAVYSLVSLSFSFVIFSYIFPLIGFTCKQVNIKLWSLNIVKDYKYLVLFLIPFVLYTLLHVKMDLDVKNLDYKNTKLNTLEKYFKEALGVQDKIPFVIKAPSIDELIEKSKEITSLHVDSYLPLSNLLSLKEFQKRDSLLKEINFVNLRQELETKAQELGFRKGFFANAYPEKLLNQNHPEYNLQSLNEYGVDIVYDGHNYYTYGLLPKDTEVKNVYIVQSTKLFEQSLKSIQDELFICGVIILIGILLLLYKQTQANFAKALSYILFPISLILVFISFNPVNILQIFMLFVIIALCIDYGIYVSQKKLENGSEKAILFSLLSTFAGFGVLVFSSIGVLFYIGEVATLGLIGILILLIIGKK